MSNSNVIALQLKRIVTTSRDLNPSPNYPYLNTKWIFFTDICEWDIAADLEQVLQS